MNFEEVYETAESKCHFLDDRECIKIWVGSSSDNSVVGDVVNSLRAEIKKSGFSNP